MDCALGRDRDESEGWWCQVETALLKRLYMTPTTTPFRFLSEGERECRHLVVVCMPIYSYFCHCFLNCPHLEIIVTFNSCPKADKLISNGYKFIFNHRLVLVCILRVCWTASSVKPRIHYFYTDF